LPFPKSLQEIKMAPKLKTVSVRLDRRAGTYIDRAAKLLQQSQGAFLARVGEEAAEQVLLKWAVEQYSAGVASLSELAAQTDLPLEAIAQQVAPSRAKEATEVYLAGSQKFYTTAKKVLQLYVPSSFRKSSNRSIICLSPFFL
jgi:uncharacterized protein (DUF1778 family)